FITQWFFKAELEAALHRDDVEFISDLIACLLQGCYQRRDITPQTFHSYLEDIINYRWELEEGKPNPLRESAFQDLPLRTRVEILHRLCDYRLDADDVFDLLKGLDADSLRVEPLGEDNSGALYWYFYGTRMYKEDPVRGKSNGELSLSRGSIEQFWTCLCFNWCPLFLCFSEKQEENSLASEPQARNGSQGPGQGTWWLLCQTEEEWRQVTESFRERTSLRERQLYKLLSEDFLPEICNMIAQKGKRPQRTKAELQRGWMFDHLSVRSIKQEETPVLTRIEKQKRKEEEEERQILLAVQKKEQEQMLKEERKRELEEKVKAVEDRAKRRKLREERAWLLAQGKELPPELSHLDPSSPMREEKKTKDLMSWEGPVGGKWLNCLCGDVETLIRSCVSWGGRGKSLWRAQVLAVFPLWHFCALLVVASSSGKPHFSSSYLCFFFFPLVALLDASQRPTVPGTFGPLRGSDPTSLYGSSGVPEPHPGEPVVQQHQPFSMQPPVGINSHRGPGLGTPEEKQMCGGLAHLSNMAPHPGSLQLGQMSGPGQDGNLYPPAQFQPGFIPPRHGGAPARPPDFPESTEIPPSHMYRSYKYLNRVHSAVWNGNHGATNPGPLGPDEKPLLGPGPSHQPRTLGHMMDSRVMRPPIPPSQWTEQSSFLPHGVPSSGYIRPPCKSAGHRLQTPPAPSSLFGAPSQALRGVQGGDSMMDSPEMIAMQQLSSRVCPPGVPYHPRQPAPPHIPGPFPQVAHSASVGVPAPKPALGNPGRPQDNRETPEPENDREPLPGLEEKPASVAASEGGAYLKQLPHPAPPLQPGCARQSSPRERGTVGPELKSDSSESADSCKAGKGKAAWPSDSSYPSPAAQGCLRDLSTVADRGTLPENGVISEASPCGSEGKGLGGNGSEKPLCPRGKMQDTMPCTGQNATTPPHTDPGLLGGTISQFSPLYVPGLEYPNAAAHYHINPGLPGLGPVVGGKASVSHPQHFPPRGFQSNSPHSGVFPRYRPHQGMRYSYHPPPQPSYHHYQRTPYYTCPQGFSDWQRPLHPQGSPGGPPSSQPPPPRSLFSDKNAVANLQGCETLHAALTSPARMDAVAAKVVPADGQNPGPEEEKLDESMERPESPKEFLDLDNHNAATKRQSSLSASDYLYGTAPLPLSSGMGFGSPTFPPHGVMLQAGPPYTPQRPASHLQPRAYSAPGTAHPPHCPAAAQPNGLSPEGPVYHCQEEGLGHFQAVMMEQIGSGSGLRGPFQEMYRPSGAQMHPVQSQASFPKTPAPAGSQEELPPPKPPTLPLDQVRIFKN
uniref:CECR2 histone acetyl-lysine reader n=1 Tax=Propithecus coquereli TaxID=379532 RepID=A0A2K6G7T1_PROCO